MLALKNILRFLRNELYLKRLTDEEYFLWRHKRIFGYTPDFKNPQTFNEKIIHRILYDRNPIYTLLADKIKARIYIAYKLLEQSNSNNQSFFIHIGGGDIFDQTSPIWKPINDIKPLLMQTNLCPYLPKLYGIWDTIEEIDFSSLPDSFVLKTNHDGGGIIIVKDKTSFLANQKDFRQAIKKLKKHLSVNWYSLYREYHYKDIEPKVFAEELLSECTSSFVIPKDYKIHTFSNNLYFQVDFDRFHNHTRAIYNHHGQSEDVKYAYSAPKNLLPLNQGLIQECRSVAEKLFIDKFLYTRIDLYLTPKIFVGELTFTPEGGTGKFEPNEWDKKLGQCWK